MSTHLDGAPPSMADPDDGDPDDGDLQPSEFDDGSHWVRAEIAAPDGGEPLHPRPPRAPWRRGRRLGRAARPRCRRARHPARAGTAAPAAVRAVPLPPPGFAAAGDLPENYVPRHSVQTPGPAAEPAEPVSGPIPIVRPATATTTRPAHRPWAARRSRPRACRCRSARSAVVPVLRCRSAAPRRVRGHGRPPRSSRTSPCSDSARRPAGSVPTNRCPPGGFRPPHRGVSRPRATRMPAAGGAEAVDAAVPDTDGIAGRRRAGGR